MFEARIISIYPDGSTSSIVGRFDSEDAAKERARNHIENPGGPAAVATLVLPANTRIVAHYEAVEDGRRRSGVIRYKAEQATGFREMPARSTVIHRCKCGYETNSEAKIVDHISYMLSVVGDSSADHNAL